MSWIHLVCRPCEPLQAYLVGNQGPLAYLRAKSWIAYANRDGSELAWTEELLHAYLPENVCCSCPYPSALLEMTHIEQQPEQQHGTLRHQT
ncbi:hypothetical protein D3C75_1140920 [compost metagenome]